MFGIITPQPLNFLRTLESIPLGRLHDSCRYSWNEVGGHQTVCLLCREVTSDLP